MAAAVSGTVTSCLVRGTNLVKKAAGAAVICGRDAVPRPEGAGKVRGAAESPAVGDLGDGHLAQALIG